MRRILLSVLMALTLSGCVAHDHEYDHRDSRREAESRQQAEYRDDHGQSYRHARWHDEDVYRREDGHWYSRRNNDWVLRAEIDLQ
jgi:hypothetical protein